MQDAAAKANAICERVRSIPKGTVATYGQVADMAGLPRRARLVGKVLRELPNGSDVPWYRVITAAGVIAFPLGSDAHRRQAARLRDEGVVVVQGRIALRRFRWQPSLDELLWKPKDLGT